MANEDINKEIVQSDQDLQGPDHNAVGQEEEARDQVHTQAEVHLEEEKVVADVATLLERTEVQAVVKEEEIENIEESVVVAEVSLGAELLDRREERVEVEVLRVGAILDLHLEAEARAIVETSQGRNLLLKMDPEIKVLKN